MTTVKKKKTFGIDTEILILRDLDLLLKIPTPGTWSVVFSKEPLRELKILYVWIQIKRKYISNLIFSIAVIKCLIKKFQITHINLK